MAHLGDRVAAFVDGQLSDDEHEAALGHLQDCWECQAVVRQQRLLKRRMTGLNDVPEPPASLVSSLADPSRMGRSGGPKRSRISRLLHLPVVRVVVALTGASVTFGAVAYAVGPPLPNEDETVSPPVERFVAEFVAASSSPLRPVGSARSAEALGIRPVSAATGSVARGGDSAEALRLLSRVRGARGSTTFDLLVKNFDLSIGRRDLVDGRPAIEVVAGDGGHRSASYWIDETDGRLLQRAAYDAHGLPVAQTAPDRADVRTLHASDSSSDYADDGSLDGTAPASSSLSGSTMRALTQSGWPCHDVLAGDLQRVDGHWTEDHHEHVVTLTYTDGVSTLSVYEQSGALDDERLADFEPTRISDSTVWVRPGSPAVAVWDDAGVVYTVVTDAGRRRLAQAVGDLPRTPRRAGVVDRVGGGVQRLGGWLDPTTAR